jgi:uncharacterized DUF497 family protein
VRVVWSDEKADENWRKHGVSFEDASELFTGGNDYLEIFDEDHSFSEDRFVCLGAVRCGLIVVIKTEPDEGVVRILSARHATKREAVMYRNYVEGKRRG